MIADARDGGCIYCGYTAECRDHYIPVSWSGCHRSYARGSTVPCCTECNNGLNALPAFTIEERAKYLSAWYEKRAGKILSLPMWTKGELSEMSVRMRGVIEAGLLAKMIYESKLSNLDLVINGGSAVPIQ